MQARAASNNRTLPSLAEIRDLRRRSRMSPSGSIATELRCPRYVRLSLNRRHDVAASRIALTFLLVAGRTFTPRNGDFRNGELAMANDERRSSDERRSAKDRRSGIDTRSDQERRLIGERRSNNERRSGLDRRSSNKANVSPMTGRRGTH